MAPKLIMWMWLPYHLPVVTAIVPCKFASSHGSFPMLSRKQLGFKSSVHKGENRGHSVQLATETTIAAAAARQPPPTVIAPSNKNGANY